MLCSCVITNQSLCFGLVYIFRPVPPIISFLSDLNQPYSLTIPPPSLPPSLPPPTYTTGGQTEEQATENLNLINQLAKQAPSSFRPSLTTCPWMLSFSFGRSLQASVLAAWEGKEENYTAAVAVAGALAKANAQAQLGEYVGPHPSLLKGKSLHETNRGFYGQGAAGVAAGAAAAAAAAAEGKEEAAEVSKDVVAEKERQGEGTAEAKAEVEAEAPAAAVDAAADAAEGENSRSST